MQLAFPSAKGSGAYTTGGAGGTVLRVTTLDPGEFSTGTNQGTFMWCFRQEFTRIIVFDVSGEIKFNLFGDEGFSEEGHLTGPYGDKRTIDPNDVHRKNHKLDNVTIAGETSPGGITLSAPTFAINYLNNIIIRYVRFSGKHVPYSTDCMHIYNCRDILLDHCTWLNGSDEVLTIRSTDGSYPGHAEGTGKVTIQRNLIASGFTGMILGGLKDNESTVINNLWVSISHRFPNPSDVYGNGQMDIVNNVVCNWSQRWVSINFSGSNTHVGDLDLNNIGNYFKVASSMDTESLNFWSQECNKIRQDNGLLFTEARLYSSKNKLVGSDGTPWSGTNPPIEGNEGDLLWRDFFNDSVLQSDNWFRDLQTGELRDQFPLVGKTYPIQSADDTFTDVTGNIGANAYLDNNHNKVSYLSGADNQFIQTTVTGQTPVRAGFKSEDQLQNLDTDITGDYKVKIYNAANNDWDAGCYVTVSVNGIEVINSTGTGASTSGLELPFTISNTSDPLVIKVWWKTKAYQNKVEILDPNDVVLDMYVGGYYQIADPETGSEYLEDDGFGWAQHHPIKFTRPVGWTTQPDGIPDSWKVANGLDTGIDYTTVTFSATRAGVGGLPITDPSAWWGYTGIQIYLNEIDGDIVDIPVTGVTIDQSTLVVNVPNTGQLTYTIVPATATNQSGIWSSSNDAIATVNQSGVVTAVSEGEAIITFETSDGGFTDTSVITITENVIHVTTVDVTPEIASSAGETVQFDATVLPVNATDKSGVWSSDNENIAIVNQTGLATPITNGQVAIRFTANDRVLPIITTGGLANESGLKTWDWSYVTIPVYNDSKGINFSYDQLAIDSEANDTGTAISVVNDELQFYVNPTTPPVEPWSTRNFNMRAEIRTAPWNVNNPLGTEEWFGWSYTFGDNYIIDVSNQFVMFQIFAGVAGFSPPIRLEVIKDGQFSGHSAGEIYVMNIADDPNTDYTPTGITPVAGQKLDIVIHVVHNTLGNGLLKVWIDGVVVYDKINIATVDATRAWGGNAKFGIYKNEWDDGANVTLSANQGITDMKTSMGDLSIITRFVGDLNYLQDDYITVDPSTPLISGGISDFGTLTVNIPSGDTVSAFVSDDLGDVKEEKITPDPDSGGNIYSSSVELGYDTETSNWWINGLRFEGLNIPANKEVTQSYLSFICHDASTSTGVIQLLIQAEAVDAPAPFTQVPKNLSTRTVTTEQVVWSPEDWTVNGDEYTSIDISNIIQELINRGGYSVSDAINILIRPVDTTLGGFGNTRNAYSHNYDTGLAPKLTITYDEPSGGIINVESVTISPINIVILEGFTQQLTANILPINADNQNGVWSVGDTNIATISPSGLLTAVTAGTTTVRFEPTDQVNGPIFDETSVIVQIVTVPVDSIDVNPNTLALDVGNSSIITFVTVPTNATTQTGSWTSDDENIAIVTNLGGGRASVGAIGEGTTTITFISDYGVQPQDTCIVTVTDPIILVTEFYVKKSHLKGLL